MTLKDVPSSNPGSDGGRGRGRAPAAEGGGGGEGRRGGSFSSGGGGAASPGRVAEGRAEEEAAEGREAARAAEGTEAEAAGERGRRRGRLLGRRRGRGKEGRRLGRERRGAGSRAASGRTGPRSTSPYVEVSRVRVDAARGRDRDRELLHLAKSDRPLLLVVFEIVRVGRVVLPRPLLPEEQNSFRPANGSTSVGGLTRSSLYWCWPSPRGRAPSGTTPTRTQQIRTP